MSERISKNPGIADYVVASRKHKVIDILPEDREEDDAEASEVTVSYSDDADAAWLRKGNRAYYGYKIHAATDSRDGFLLGGHVTPANRSDTQEFIDLLDEIRVCSRNGKNRTLSLDEHSERPKHPLFGCLCYRQGWSLVRLRTYP